MDFERKSNSFIKGNSFENGSKMTATLSRPECVNTLRPILSGLYLAEYVSKLISKFRCNLNKILFSYLEIDLKLSSGKWRPYYLGLYVLPHCCRGKVASVLHTTF